MVKHVIALPNNFEKMIAHNKSNLRGFKASIGPPRCSNREGIIWASLSRIFHRPPPNNKRCLFSWEKHEKTWDFLRVWVSWGFFLGISQISYLTLLLCSLTFSDTLCEVGQASLAIRVQKDPILQYIDLNLRFDSRLSEPLERIKTELALFLA